MKITIVLTKDTGTKMWDFEMNYFDLPEPYAWAVAEKAASLASFIEGLKKKAASVQPGGKAYAVTFNYAGDAAEGEASARNLSYSQAVKVQRAGWRMLDQLIESAETEIASGQRE